MTAALAVVNWMLGIIVPAPLILKIPFNIVTAATGTAASAIVKGIFRINGAGTIIPSIQLTTASAAVIGVNTWFKCYPVGTNTVISVGNWA